MGSDISCLVSYFRVSFSEFNLIIIGPGHSAKLLDHLLNKDLLFESLCFQIIYMLHELNLKHRCLIYITVLSIFLSKKYSIWIKDNKSTDEKKS